jgi:hypothetical protein
VLGKLEPKGGAAFRLRFRLWNHTFVEVWNYFGYFTAYFCSIFQSVHPRYEQQAEIICADHCLSIGFILQCIAKRFGVAFEGRENNAAPKKNDKYLAHCLLDV